MTQAELPPAGALDAAAVVVDELAALGVTDIVVCPGARSAPLAYAAFAAQAAGYLRLWVRVDERAAGFFALGLAKTAQRAVAIVTTSGTAVANLAPALLEARHAHVPLLALTADRPATLVGTGANQTTDQLALLRGCVRQVIRLASADAAPAAWRNAIRRAVVAAEGRLDHTPGPIHVNLELTPPLVGSLRLPDRAEAATKPGVHNGFWADSLPAATPIVLPPGPRTVVVAGDLAPGLGQAWAQQCELTRTPLLAEPSSNARQAKTAIRYYRRLLETFVELVDRIERVVVIGHPTLSRAVTRLLSRPDCEVVAVGQGADWIDPGWAVNRVVPAATLPPAPADWLTDWQRADDQAGRIRDTGVGAAMVEQVTDWQQADDQAGPSQGSGAAAATTVEQVWAALGEADVLVLGASRVVRWADEAPRRASGMIVYANRGLAGIDGTIATALGIAAASGRATTLMLGDLTAYHDLTALALPRLEQPIDLRVVILDDGGGTIFRDLEYGQLPAEDPLTAAFERVFLTPTGVDLAAVAQALGATVDQVLPGPELAAALARPLVGRHVIVVKLT